MPVRSQSDEEIVLETPHRRIGLIQRPLVTLRRGAGHVLVADRNGTSPETIRLPLERAECLRLVPAPQTGRWHGWRRTKGAWTLALRFKSGEDLILEQAPDSARVLDLARQVSEICGVELDESSQRMFGLAQPSEEPENRW